MKPSMNVSIALALVSKQLGESLNMIGKQTMTELLEEMEKLDEVAQLNRIKTITRNSFNEIVRVASDLSKEYEEFLSSPDTQKELERLKEMVESDPDGAIKHIFSSHEEEESIPDVIDVEDDNGGKLQ